MSTWITICDTCKRDDWSERGAQKTDGELLGEYVSAELKALGSEGGALFIRYHSCLMSCKRACSVSLQAQNKLSYMLGAFEPCEEAARAIVEYAVAYSGSSSGQVPFKLWPQGVKGHFVARIPPLEGEKGKAQNTAEDG